MHIITKKEAKELIFQKIFNVYPNTVNTKDLEDIKRNPGNKSVTHFYSAISELVAEKKIKAIENHGRLGRILCLHETEGMENSRKAFNEAQEQIQNLENRVNTLEDGLALFINTYFEANKTIQQTMFNQYGIEN